MPKRTFDREFKLQVVRQLVNGEKRLSQLCREHSLCQTLVRRWREQYEAHGELAWTERVVREVLLEDCLGIAGRAHVRQCRIEREKSRHRNTASRSITPRERNARG